MTKLEQFIKLCKYAGERFDLVQASGGNASVKNQDGTMYIKASGYLLSGVERDRGYCIVNNKKVLKILDNKFLLQMKNKQERYGLVLKGIQKSVVSHNERPSIEVFLHSLLETYTLHTHPIAVNSIVCQKNWKAILEKIFKEIVLVEYSAPGIETALQLRRKIKMFLRQYNRKPKIVFLQNHGLIISSGIFDEIEILTEDVLLRIEEYLGVNFNNYKLTNKISRLFNSIDGSHKIAYLSSDLEINALLKRRKRTVFTKSVSPEKAVFCGISVARINSLNDTRSLIRYKKKYGELPRVILYRGNLFFIAQNITKARKMEEVFKLHMLSLSMAGSNIRNLSDEEIKYLSGWEAEKYRQEFQG